MKKERSFIPAKQSDLSNWIYWNKKNASNFSNKDLNDNREIFLKIKPKLAFGYGYNPEILNKGIQKYSLSHTLDNGLKLYEFEPKISYRIFHILASILQYKCLGSELRKNKTAIKNNYFITDKNPKQIVKEINSGLQKLFECYDPLPKYDIK